MKELISNPETKVVPHGTCPNCGEHEVVHIDISGEDYNGGFYTFEGCKSCRETFKAHWVNQFAGYSQMRDNLERKFLTEKHQETDAKREAMKAYLACKAVVDNWVSGNMAKAARMCQDVVNKVEETK